MRTSTHPNTVAPPWFSLSSAGFRADPYPFYARLRQEAPIVHMRHGNRGESFFVTRYQDVMTVLTDVEHFANDRRNAGLPVSRLRSAMSMGMDKAVVMQDGADHRRLRNLAHKAFSSARVAALEERVRTITGELLDAARRGEIDIIADLALPLPLTVISDMFGVEQADRHRFHKWVNGFLAVDGDVNLIHLAGIVPNVVRLNRFLHRLIEQRRASRGDDLLSALVAAEEDGDRLSTEELFATTFALLLAGHETTVNLIGNGVLALLDNPDQLERLRAEPSLIDTAVEELLRFTSPVQINAPRYVKEDTVLAGVRLTRGTSVAPVLASANHDETRFDNPERLDLARQQNRHVAFGYGVHFCLGASLARLEARVVFTELLRRFSTMSLAVPRSELTWTTSSSIRGLSQLPVRLSE